MNPEGTAKLYFTNERVDDRNAIPREGTGIDIVYDDPKYSLLQIQDKVVEVEVEV